MSEGYTKVRHKLWEIPMELEERYMMLFLLDCENRCKCQDEWFFVGDKDFMNVGFGSDRRRWKKYRNSLVQRGWIEYERGGKGMKSKYKIIRQKNNKDDEQDEDKG